MKRTRLSIPGLSAGLIFFLGISAFAFVYAWLDEKPFWFLVIATFLFGLGVWLRFSVVTVYSSGALLIFSDGARDRYIAIEDVVSITPGRTMGRFQVVEIAHYKRVFGHRWISRSRTVAWRDQNDQFPTFRSKEPRERDA